LLLFQNSTGALHRLALPAHVLAEMTVGMPPLQMTVDHYQLMVALLNALRVTSMIAVSPWFGTFRAASIYILMPAALDLRL